LSQRAAVLAEAGAAHRLSDRAAAAARRDRLGLLFLAPGVLLVLCLSIFPLLMSLVLSFVHWDMSNPAAGVRWAGFAHWGRLFDDTHFLIVLRNTLLYVIIGIPLQYALGLMLACALDREIRARNLLRVLFLVPMMMSPVVVAFVVGRVMFNEAVGPVNAALQAAGLAPVPWLSDSLFAFVTVVLVDTWQWTPFFMLVLLAGLSAVPKELEEAASLDTTSNWQAFWWVTFPVLAPWSVTAILIRSIEMLKIVDVIVVLTNGGPGIATESLTLYAYRTGVVNFDLGYAAALSFSLLVIAALLATSLLLATRALVTRAS
jgi:multiple sugar transport system permease protein